MAFPEAMAAVQRHIRAADTLAAIGAGLGAAAGRIQPNETLNAKLEAVVEAFEPDAFAGLSQDELDALYGFVRAAMRQMLHLVELPDDGSAGWSFDDPNILETQGRSSRIITRLLTDYAGRDPQFAAMLQGGGRFLDVGSGVGWISLSMAQQWPKLEAVGIDILEPALALAAKNLQETGLSDRVAFRRQNVVDLQDTDAFDAIFIPVIFIPATIIDETFRNLRRALRPGGWVFAAAYRVPDDSRMAALNSLKTGLSGGRAWSVPELSRLAETAGLSSIGDIGVGSPLHLWGARREA
ncbi:SAM-dependent methyltransferase [Acuticoccus kandeliae]|uniref:SAM-dependent methyltransferase n=1 Tax=Acuticoccus kandeliae TaxID=2073160 RepID=UPI000D3E7656|nr:class I SAM-dependent methyltransferase [Acuticoccus kandeliae]